MHTHLVTRYLLTLFLIITLAGCADLDHHIKTIKPTASLVGTRLTDINFEQAKLVFDVAVKNKNPFSIRLAGLDYDLKVAGNSLVSGVTGQGIKIKKNSTSKVALPVILKFDDLRNIPGQLWSKDQFTYQLDSSINIKLPVIGNYAIPFSKKGELPVPKLPNIKLRDLQIRDLSLTSAHIVAEVEVDNPNNFVLGLSSFNYQLNINQQTWGEGLSSKSNSIPKKGKGTISIPLKLNLLSMGKTAYQILTSGNKINYQILGGITLDTGMDFLRSHKMPLNIKGTTSFN
ncbi:MAG: LEA type 2 family protein [Gammaproteobacteria bacterium]|nr:LEA type 2 family protein [Gammaproteobacteria bacterium]